MDTEEPSSTARRFRRRVADQAEMFNLPGLLLRLPPPRPGRAVQRLRELFEADQDDRREGKLSPGAGERDRERRKFVMSLLDDEFGTQYVDDGGVWDLYWVDPATTDDERAEWDVPTLTEAYELLAAMNEEERGKGATARE